MPAQIESSAVETLRLALRAQVRLLSGAHLAEAATALANELFTALPARGVHVGIKEGATMRLLATAHGDATVSPGASGPLLVAAMEECADQGQIIAYPPYSEPYPNSDDLTVVLAHQALARQTGTAVVSVPLMDDQAIVGVLSLEVDGPLPAAPTLCQIAVLSGPLLALRRRAEAPLLSRWREDLTGGWRRATPARRAAMALGGLLLCVLLFAPLPRSVVAEARIEGEIQRTLVAPAEGFVEKAFVRPGDLVTKGQVLVQLADRELRLEKTKLENELARHQSTFIAAQSQGERGQMMVAGTKMEETRARLALIDGQLEKTALQAPMDGVVLTGDLDQSQGKPVQRGEALLVVAPRQAYRLMIETDERDIARLSQGSHGRLALAALPGTALGFTVTRIMPVATAQDGRHFVEAEARLEALPAGAQPGMRGVARVEAGRAPLAAQLTERVRHWLGLRLWSWSGL